MVRTLGHLPLPALIPQWAGFRGANLRWRKEFLRRLMHLKIRIPMQAPRKWGIENGTPA